MTDSCPLKRSLEENSENMILNEKKICSDKTVLKISEVNDSQKSINLLEITPSSNKDSTFTSASENDVGITEFVSDLSGFFAVIKERYSDFLVNEIDLQGNIIRLTNLEKPVISTGNHSIQDLLDSEIVQNLQELSGGNVVEVMIEVTNKDKDSRTKIHQAIRENFPGFESTTVDKDSKKFITVEKQDSKFKGRRFVPSPAGNYIHFVMYKENRDTMDAINTMSSYLRVPPKNFSYAGTKDKRAKTSQLVSAYRLNVDKLLSINKKFNNIKVGNIVYKSEQLKLGDLSGNLFAIILRQLDGNLELIGKAMKSLALNGFLNYYGLQRFGTSAVATHSIGRALLLGDWRSAINLILQPRLEGDENLARSRKIWIETKNAKKALENLRNKSSIEGKLLHGLSLNNENDLVNALNSIPRNTRLMYIHSYQSFVWNRVLSQRIKKHGLSVLPGDLISNNSEVQEELHETTDREECRKIMLSTSVKHISEAEMDNVTLSDILLPLPGHSVTYPNNECNEWYTSFLKEDGMDLGNFESRVKTYSLSGAYRKIIVIPSDVKWDIVPYDDVSEPLVLSDLDVLMKHKPLEQERSGSKKALKMEFKLPSSSYATMAIREVLKCSTSFSSKKI